MIRFRCNNCGQLIQVADQYAAHQGRCPRCKEITLIPPVEKAVPVRKPVEIHQESARQPADDPASEIKLKEEAVDKPNMTTPAMSGDYAAAIGQAESETPDARNRHKLLYVFLYPSNMNGLVNIFIYWSGWIIIDLLSRISIYTTIFIVIRIMFVAYMYSYFILCVRESTEGGTRAPSNITDMPDFSEARRLMFYVFAATALYIGPAAIYYAITKRINDTFLSLVVYGALFYPMGLLAVIMFESMSAFNPSFLMGSIKRTFIAYMGLVVCLFGLGVLLHEIESYMMQSMLSGYLLIGPNIYLMMIGAHLLGRFYYFNEKKLDWGI